MTASLEPSDAGGTVVEDAGATSAVGAYRWYVLALLAVAYAIHALDRTVITVLIEPIKHEYHVTDAALGFMTGLGYAIPFALAGLPLGVLIDRVRRQRLLALLLVIWSGMTALGGVTRSFLTLVLTRSAVGAAESGSPPAALSLVSDYFPPRLRALAVSVFYGGAPVGAVIGVYFTSLITARYGWRAALLVAGAPGILLAALILLTVREPARGALDLKADDASPPFSAVFRLIGAYRGLALVVAALILGSMAQVGSGSWMPAVLMRAYHLPVARMGALMGSSGIFGAGGVFLGGFLSNVYAKGRTERLLLICGVSFLATIPFSLIVLLNPTPVLPIAPLLIAGTIAPIYYGPGFSLALSLAPPAMRGRMMGLTFVLCNILGAGIGPQIVGLVSDVLHARADAHALQHGVACLSVAAVAAGLMFLLAIRYLPRGVTHPLELETDLDKSLNRR